MSVVARPVRRGRRRRYTIYFLGAWSKFEDIAVFVQARRLLRSGKQSAGPGHAHHMRTRLALRGPTACLCVWAWSLGGAGWGMALGDGARPPTQPASTAQGAPVVCRRALDTTPPSPLLLAFLTGLAPSLQRQARTTA